VSPGAGIGAGLGLRAHCCLGSAIPWPGLDDAHKLTPLTTSSVRLPLTTNCMSFPPYCVTFQRMPQRCTLTCVAEPGNSGPLRLVAVGLPVVLRTTVGGAGCPGPGRAARSSRLHAQQPLEGRR
jgi:hypothetical protein